MNELEQILSRKRARKRILYYLVSIVMVFVVCLGYFVFILAFLGSTGTGVDWSSWTNILLASALIITAPFTVLFVYEIYLAWSDDRNLITYCREHPELKLEIDDIESKYSKKKEIT